MQYIFWPYRDLEASTSEDEFEDDDEMKVEHWRAQRICVKTAWIQLR